MPDDPALIPIASFLAELRSSAPPRPTHLTEQRHLAALAVEVDRLQAERPGENLVGLHRPARRIVATASVAVFGVLTAGVGVAAAAGIDPLEVIRTQLPVLVGTLVPDKPEPSVPDNPSSGDSSPNPDPEVGDDSTSPNSDLPGNGNQGEDKPGNGNKDGDKPGKGNQDGDKPGKGNQGKDKPGNGNQGGDKPGKGNQGSSGYKSGKEPSNEKPTKPGQG